MFPKPPETQDCHLQILQEIAKHPAKPNRMHFSLMENCFLLKEAFAIADPNINSSHSQILIKIRAWHIVG